MVEFRGFLEMCDPRTVLFGGGENVLVQVDLWGQVRIIHIKGFIEVVLCFWANRVWAQRQWALMWCLIRVWAGRGANLWVVLLGQVWVIVKGSFLEPNPDQSQDDKISEDFAVVTILIRRGLGMSVRSQLCMIRPQILENSPLHVLANNPLCVHANSRRANPKCPRALLLGGPTILVSLGVLPLIVAGGKLSA